MVMARGYQMTSSGHAIKNANVSIQCEFYANGYLLSIVVAVLRPLFLLAGVVWCCVVLLLLLWLLLVSLALRDFVNVRF